MSSRILEFYRLEEPDSQGRMLDEYWGWDDENIENIHDFIQWMFPLDEPSGFNPDAPIITPQDAVLFRRDPVVRSHVKRSMEVFLHFLGLKILQDGTVVPDEQFSRRLNVWREMNHNWLRITRLLKSLRLLGFEDECKSVWKCLRKLHEDDGYVSEDSFKYWREAVEGLEFD